MLARFFDYLLMVLRVLREAFLGFRHCDVFEKLFVRIQFANGEFRKCRRPLLCFFLILIEQDAPI